MPESKLVSLVSNLVQIPSVNPLQGGPKAGKLGEKAMADHVASLATALGAEVTLDEVLPGRCNVYALFAGTSDFVVAVDVHLDTVGVEHMTDPPFDGRVEDGRIYGRGSVDTKATIAIVLDVIDQMQITGQDLVPTVLLVGSVSEEAGGFAGAEGFAEWKRRNNQRIDWLLIAEPTMCAPVYGHKGALGLGANFKGVAAHSSKPHLGVDAIAAAGRAIVAIEAEQNHLDSQEPSTPVGNGTVAVTKLKGGLATNIIADSAQMYVGRRVAPGEDPNQVAKHLTDLITEAAAPVPVSVELVDNLAFPAFFQSSEGPLVDSISSNTGRDPETATYGTNGLQYDDSMAGHMIVFGPGSIDVAHQAVEYVDIEQLELASKVYRSIFVGESLP